MSGAAQPQAQPSGAEKSRQSAVVETVAPPHSTLRMTLAIEAGPDTAYQHMSTLTLTGESDTLSFSVPTLVLAMPGAFVEVEVRRA